MRINKISKNTIKRNTKSSVFTHLFSIPKYKKELYLCFHPKDKNIDEKEIKTWTLSSIFTNIQINDLGLLIRDMILVLMEAQSTWTLNILPRTLGYLAESFNRYIIDTNQNIYGTKKVILPKPELYVLYTGSKVIKEKEISFKKEFFNNDAIVDIKIKVITLKNSRKILKEYIKFSKVLDANNKKYGYTKKSINETIRYCIEHNTLKDYLNEYKKEVYNIMISAYDQKTATDMYGREKFSEGMQQGIQQGMQQGMQQGLQQGMRQGMQQGLQQGMVNILVRQFKDKKISAKEGAEYLNISVNEFLKLV